MYTALYRAHRPETFDEILGQEHIVRILRNQLEADTVSHAYLFCGTRGTGKTTTARILAKGVNCTDEKQRPCAQCENCIAIKDGVFMDVIEIDAASNNGVDNIRELRESVKYPPAAGRKKVYIIDEVHMLSTGAFNALLKTLEEPPDHVMFLLATTEPQKLPATILSRCMQLDFKRVPETVIVQGMEKICKEKEIDFSPGALRLIAANADGSMRDGLSILDQCISGSQTKVEREDVLEFLGTAGTETFLRLTEIVELGKVSDAILLLEHAMADGKDVRQFMKDWLSHYRNLLVVKFIRSPEDMINVSAEHIEKIKEQSDSLDLAQINQGIIQLSQTIADARWSTQPKILLELCIVKMATDLINPGISPSDAQSISADHPGKTQKPKKPEPAKGKPHQSTKARPSQEVHHQQGEPKEKTKSLNRSTDTRREFDCDAIWYAVFEEGEKQQGSFNLFRTGTKLNRIDENNFYITASSQGTAQYAENARGLLEELMEKHTGKRRIMVCDTQEQQTENHRRADAKDMAKSAQQALGIEEVEVQ